MWNWFTSANLSNYEIVIWWDAAIGTWIWHRHSSIASHELFEFMGPHQIQSAFGVILARVILDENSSGECRRMNKQIVNRRMYPSPADVDDTESDINLYHGFSGLLLLFGKLGRLGELGIQRWMINTVKAPWRCDDISRYEMGLITQTAIRISEICHCVSMKIRIQVRNTPTESPIELCLEKERNENPNKLDFESSSFVVVSFIRSFDTYYSGLSCTFCTSQRQHIRVVVKITEMT